MSHPESSSKRLLPFLLGASILGGGLISVAVAIQIHEQSAESPVPLAQSTSSTVIASPTATAATAAKPAPSAALIPAPQTAASPVAQQNLRPADTFQSSDFPSVGTVKEMVTGDLMCYLTVQDDRGVTRQVGATFEVCRQTNFLNQRARFSYEPASVSDCESAEVCDKSRKTLVVSRIELADGTASRPNPDPSAAPSADRYTITNGEWTITVGNIQSWSGVNSTGAFSYDGCNSKNECLKLQGGKMVCRNGICAIGWKNGDYLYTLESPMGEKNDTARLIEATTLTVRQGDTVIMQVGGFRKTR